MLQNIKNRKEGFTIIEVLIVLAIAGLILLVVFLAVPALQRNSRNTSMKNDVQNVLGGITEFQNANSGAMPTTIATTSGVVKYSGSTNDTTIKVQGSTTARNDTAPTGTNGPANGTIIVVLGARCDGSTNARATAAYYSIETSGNSQTKQCQDS
jgi:prepilin-type N-terminal cleavage/methylation domain-containing protein